MKLTRSPIRQYALSTLTVVAAATASYPFANIIGYRAVALILMFVVSVLAMRMSLQPVLLAAVLSAAIWDYFFIPPYFTFHVNDPADALMLGMYFIIALLNGVLTARIRRLEKIAREEEAKVNTLKLYDTLFNSLAHELRTPIATILSASDSLLTDETTLDKATQKALFVEISAASERLNRLTSDLLNQSRLDSGFIRPKLDWCDAGELIYTVINRLDPLLHYHRIVVKLKENTPLVRLDFGLMEQVVHNIVLNAATHTPEGGLITIEAAYREGVFMLLVSDSGNGFPPTELSQVFEKFHRFSSAKTKGIGLGLSIAKGFVGAHGGTIKAENIPGGGARISIRIPTESSSLNIANHA